MRVGRCPRCRRFRRLVPVSVRGTSKVIARICRRCADEAVRQGVGGAAWEWDP